MAAFTERLADLASGMMLDTAEVTAVSWLGTDFVRVELTAESFRRASWAPGTKVQLRPRRGTMSLRTYTPVGWDSDRGVTELIGFTHGAGPGARWLREVAVGDPAELFGPRRSIDFSGLTGPTLFVGDESSVALAYALRGVVDDCSYVFEAHDPGALTGVLAQLAITDRVTTVATAPDRAQVLRHARELGGSTLVVTGDAATVHALRRDSRGWPRPPQAVVGKAYWAAGRTGLD